MRRTKGTTEQLKSGRWRARRAENGRYRTVPRPGVTFATEEEAQAVLDEFDPTPDGLTLGKFGLQYLERRALAKYRDIGSDRSRWKYVTDDAIGKVLLRDLKRSDVRDFRDRLLERLEVSTVINALNLLRVALDDALDRDLVQVNAATGVRVPRNRLGRTTDGWTVLDPDEQIALLRQVPEHEWATVAFALGSGLRQGEQWALTWADVDVVRGSVTVRQSAKWGRLRPTKSGKVRRIVVFGVALDALRMAHERRKGSCPWVFPTARGKLRATAQPKEWHQWIKAAGIRRRVRWHDLRHTCGTSLVGGWWGREWRLEEVRLHLGHSNIRTTERYAHLFDDILAQAAGATSFHAPIDAVRTNGQKTSGATYQSRTGDPRFTNSKTGQGFSALAVQEFLTREFGRDALIREKMIEATHLAFDMGKNPVAKARVHRLLADMAGEFTGVKRAG